MSEIIPSIQMRKPREVLAVLQVKVSKFLFENDREIVRWRRRLDVSREKCYQYLTRISMSYYYATCAMGSEEMRDAMCIMILILKAMDTIEDDMQITEADRRQELRKFYQHLDEPEWRYMESNIDADKHLLEDFPIITGVFRSLKPLNQDKIREITRVMGDGMATHLTKNMRTLNEMHSYFYYIAGLLCRTCTDMALANLDPPKELTAPDHITFAPGYLLQGADNIQDFYKDTEEGLIIWPQEVWAKYCDSIHQLKDEAHTEVALFCLNEMVLDVLQYIPDCVLMLADMEPRLQQGFNMLCLRAIALLQLMYNNKQIFTEKKVCLRPGHKARLQLISYNSKRSFREMEHIFKKMKKRVPQGDHLTEETNSALGRAINACRQISL